LPAFYEARFLRGDSVYVFKCEVGDDGLPTHREDQQLLLRGNHFVRMGENGAERFLSKDLHRVGTAPNDDSEKGKRVPITSVIHPKRFKEPMAYLLESKGIKAVDVRMGGTGLFSNKWPCAFPKNGEHGCVFTLGVLIVHGALNCLQKGKWGMYGNMHRIAAMEVSRNLSPLVEKLRWESRKTKKIRNQSYIVTVGKEITPQSFVAAPLTLTAVRLFLAE